MSDDGQHIYLRAIPREQVAHVIDALFQLYISSRLDGEEAGYCFRRLGLTQIIEFLKEHQSTRHLMQKTHSTADLLESAVASCRGNERLVTSDRGGMNAIHN